jgi:hypothetical protein
VYRSLKLKTTPIKDDLKILNIEYLNNHWSDLIQILNLSYGDQTKVYRSFRLKTTTNWQPLVISYAKFKLKLRGPHQKCTEALSQAPRYEYEVVAKF